MRALIDSDVLAYEVGFSGQYVDEETGEIVPRDWEFVKELLDERINSIQEAVWADEPPVLYLTYDRALNKLDNKERARLGLPPVEFIPNFRFGIAKTKPYKERGNAKPIHYNSLRAHMLFNYNVKSIPGIEADDAMCIDQWADYMSSYKKSMGLEFEEKDVSTLNTIICTRDKDLRMCPGLHYGWECGKQEGFGPKFVDEVGWLEHTSKGIKGAGLLFFYSQMITGDSVDSIPGLPGGGASKVKKHLVECKNVAEAEEVVKQLYEDKLGDGWEEYYNEQASLLWMVRETKEGRPVGWNGQVYDVPIGEPMVRRGVSFE